MSNQKLSFALIILYLWLSEWISRQGKIEIIRQCINMNRKIFFSLFAETNTFRLIVLCNSILTKRVGKSQKCHWVGDGRGGGGGGGGIYDKLALNWKFPGSGCSKAKVSSVWPSDPDAKC